LLVHTARILPEAAEASWTYRVTEVRNGVHWSQGTMTETIDAAWRVAPDGLMAQHRVVKDHDVSIPQILCNCPHYLLSDGVAWGDGVKSLGQVRAFFDTVATRKLDKESGPFEHIQLRSPIEGDALSGSVIGYNWSSDEDESVTVGGQRFDGCFRTATGIGIGIVEYGWFCPGTGFVRHEQHFAKSSCCGPYHTHSLHAVFELISWHLPTVVPAP